MAKSGLKGGDSGDPTAPTGKIAHNRQVSAWVKCHRDMLTPGSKSRSQWSQSLKLPPAGKPGTQRRAVSKELQQEGNFQDTGAPCPHPNPAQMPKPVASCRSLPIASAGSSPAPGHPSTPQGGILTWKGGQCPVLPQPASARQAEL